MVESRSVTLSLHLLLTELLLLDNQKLVTDLFSHISKVDYVGDFTFVALLSHLDLENLIASSVVARTI